MAVEHLVVAQALGFGGGDILLADFVEKAVLGQQGHGGEVADHQRGDRQHQMPEVVEDLAQGAQFVIVVRGQPTQREPVEVAATGKHHDQQNREQKRRDGVADDDRRAGPHVELTAVASGFGDPQRDRHQVHDQRAP